MSAKFIRSFIKNIRMNEMSSSNANLFIDIELLKRNTGSLKVIKN